MTSSDGFSFSSGVGDEEAESYSEKNDAGKEKRFHS